MEKVRSHVSFDFNFNQNISEGISFNFYLNFNLGQAVTNPKISKYFQSIISQTQNFDMMTKFLLSIATPSYNVRKKQ